MAQATTAPSNSIWKNDVVVVDVRISSWGFLGAFSLCTLTARVIFMLRVGRRSVGQCGVCRRRRSPSYTAARRRFWVGSAPQRDRIMWWNIVISETAAPAKKKNKKLNDEKGRSEKSRALVFFSRFQGGRFHRSRARVSFFLF